MNVGDVGRCLGDEKLALCRRCCVVQGLTHPEATAATGQKRMSHCLTRPVEVWWHEQILQDLLLCCRVNVGDVGRCLGDEKLALCQRCCVVQGLTHPEATAATGQKRMSHCLTRPVEVLWHEQTLQDLLLCCRVNVGDVGRCLGDEKLALCRRCCVVQGLTHPEATAATGQKRMSHCLTRPVEVWWHEQILQDLLLCCRVNVGDVGRCLGDEKLALCQRCCVVQGLTHPEATAATGQKRMSHCLTRPVEVLWHEQTLQDLLLCCRVMQSERW